MAILSQLRLQQISGSLGTIDSGVSSIAAGTAPASLNATSIADMEDIMTYFAQAIANIHGSTTFGTQTPGTIAAADGNNYDLLLDQNDAGQKIHLDSEGAVDIDAVTGISIDSVGAAANFSVASDADGEDLTIALTGATDSSIHLSSSGTAADALTIATSAGGMDITVAGAAAGEDLDISCNQEIRITSTSDAEEAIYIHANGGDNETIKIHSNQGTGTDSIVVLSDEGGIDIDATAGKVFIDGGGGIDIGTAANVAVDFNASTFDLDASGEMNLNSSGGSAFLSGSSFVGVKSSAKVEVHSGTTLMMSGSSGATVKAATGNILLDMDSASGKIHLDSESTTDGSASGGSIHLDASAGGIALVASDAKDIWVEGGRTHITANENASEAIKLHADAGAAQTIQILNDAGTVDGTEGAGAIDIEATVGGISIHAADDKDIWVEGGQAVVTANHDTAAAIKLHADAGTSQTIQLLNDEGTSSSAIDLTATAGGFSLDGVQASNMTVASAGDADDLTISVTGANDASLLLSSAGTGADALSLDVSAGSMVVAPSLADGQTLKLGKNGAVEMVFTPSGTAGNEKISLTNTAGTATDAIKILADAGGITLDADATDANAIDIDSAGGVDLDAAGELNLNSSAGATFLSGSSFVGVKSAAGIELHSGTTLVMSGSSNVTIESKSGVVRFESHDADSQMNGGYLNLAGSGEFADFVGKDQFSSTTTIIGALNALADAGTPTRWVQKVTGSHAADRDLYFGSSSAFGQTANKLIVGDSTSISATLSPAKCDVFVNGQLLVSGSSSQVSASSRDYHISAADRVKFSFALAADDMIQVIDRS